MESPRKENIVASEISSAISKSGIEVPDQETLKKCLHLCDQYNLTTKDFVNQLDAFTCGCNEKLSMENFGKFEQEVRRNFTNASKSIDKRKQLTNKRSYETNQSPGLHFEYEPRKITQTTTPNEDKKMKIPFIEDIISSNTSNSNWSSPQIENSVFKNRQNSGQIILDINNSLGKRGNFEKSDSKPIGIRCKLISHDEDFDQIKQRYRFMYTTLEERCRALDRHFEKIQTEMCKILNLQVSDLQPLNASSQNEAWVCGRICNEEAAGKIKDSSIFLEGSLRSSGGRRVRLDVSGLSSYSLFPGQIVLVYGINSTGKQIAAKQIIDGAMLELPRSVPSKLLEFHHSSFYQGGLPLTILAAAGPFTTSDNLEYEPLTALLEHMLKTKPDVVILIGPFVDISQPLLQSGQMTLSQLDDQNQLESHDASYEMVFVERVIRDGLKAAFDAEADFGVLPTRIVLVPSLQDGHHEFVYPQPPFGDRDRIDSDFFVEPLGVLEVPYSADSDPRRRVHLMPNPCMFRINEVLVGVGSNDTVFALAQEEAEKAAGGDRLQRLAGHMLRQHSFSPMFPPPSGTQLDLRHSNSWTMKTLRPDLLLSPSRLNPYCVDIQGTLTANPGLLAKGKMGGTFAEFTVHPLSEEVTRKAVIDKADSIQHDIAARTAVSIRRI